ncbi:cytochrome c oxidase subunit 5B, mitochondrial-like [Ostrea edulis]|uniref:cytochrome c oxidase subunit 5B, mitochondrial-like n=1 Tax=Ostrea edulis TaxID=37623 RepID=UPI002094F8BD|nr:cytochrome c oxidase subunit 5B, mitochondrial-like [Ostrea edulis]
MASSLCRTLLRSVRSPLRNTQRLLHTSARVSAKGINLGGGLEDHFKGNKEIEGQVPDLGGHAVGMERYEILCEMEGKDPWDMKPSTKQKGFGTRDNPHIVNSVYDRRLVGCICDEDTGQIQYFWLYKGEPKRCYCGHFFKIKEIGSSDFPQYPRDELIAMEQD